MGLKIQKNYKLAFFPWLATVDNVKTKILLLKEDIFMPELSF